MRCRGGFSIKDTDLLFSFDLVTRSSSLNKQYYSEYQTLLYLIITEMFDKGLNYRENADLLNDNGYTTSRGKKFRNAHTHSIVKRKRLSDNKHPRLYPSTMENCSLEGTDRRLVNEV